MPPETTNAVAKAAGAMTATRDPTLRRRSKVPPRSMRSCSTERASSVRSRAISRRTASGLRLVVSAIAPPGERRPRQLRFRDRLLRNWRDTAPQPGGAGREQDGSQKYEAAADEQEREPGGEDVRERRGHGRKQEAEPEEREHAARDGQRRARAHRRDLLPYFERGQLALEPNERARVLGHLLDGCLHASVAALSVGGHGFASRSRGQARFLRKLLQLPAGTESVNPCSSRSGPTLATGPTNGGKPGIAIMAGSWRPSRRRPDRAAGASRKRSYARSSGRCC